MNIKSPNSPDRLCSLEPYKSNPKPELRISQTIASSRDSTKNEKKAIQPSKDISTKRTQKRPQATQKTLTKPSSSPPSHTPLPPSSSSPSPNTRPNLARLRSLSLRQTQHPTLRMSGGAIRVSGRVLRGGGLGTRGGWGMGVGMGIWLWMWMIPFASRDTMSMSMSILLLLLEDDSSNQVWVIPNSCLMIRTWLVPMRMKMFLMINPAVLDEWIE